MADFRVVLDFGHGGSKSGASVAGVSEKNVNLLLGQKIYECLRGRKGKHKIQVMLTRDADYDIPLSARYRLINAHHEASPINLVMSVHFNAAGSPSPNGFEVYYSEISAHGASYAESVVQRVRQGGFTVRGNGAITTVQLGRRLAMIHKTEPPAVLVEAGYLTNPVDRGSAVDPEFRNKLADAISAGVWHQLTKRQP